MPVFIFLFRQKNEKLKIAQLLLHLIIMEQVSKEAFKEIYFKYGKAEDGWGQDYWDKFYEQPENDDMKYMIELPKTKQENRMMIVDDYQTKEFRLFFLSDDQEEMLFNFPDE